MKIVKLSKNLIAKYDFDCDDDDLNEFLREDSFFYEENRLAKTYLLVKDKSILAYFSILNDKLERDDCITKSQWNKKVKKALPHTKNFLDSLPAVKIG